MSVSRKICKKSFPINRLLGITFGTIPQNVLLVYHNYNVLSRCQQSYFYFVCLEHTYLGHLYISSNFLLSYFFERKFFYAKKQY